MGGGVQKYARRLTAVYYAEARTETRPGKFGLIWLCTSSVSFALPSTDSKTTTRTATSPVSYHSPILTWAILVGWNEGTFEGCLNEGEEQNVVDASMTDGCASLTLVHSQAHFIIQQEITGRCHVHAAQNPSYGECANFRTR